MIGCSYEKGSHWQCDIEEPQSLEDKNRYLEGCKIATSTRGDNDCSRGRSQEQASRHDASQFIGKFDLQDRLQEVACITESQASSGHLDSQPHRSTVWLCSVTSQGLERHPLDRWPWICLQRITLRASQESGVAICGNTTQRSTSNLARSLI